MYATRKMPGSLDGIESLNFAMYWNAIKDRINDLQQLPVWATNHAMKLGIVVSKLQAMGRQDLVDGLQLEIRKVNDDIVKAWKVKGYIDEWLPKWMEAASSQTQGAPIVGQIPYAVPIQSMEVTQYGEELGPGNMRQAYVQPTLINTATGWVKNLFGVSAYPEDRGLGFLPLIAVAVSIPALAYIVTTGMALYQDYIVKKDLTADVILGKLTSGQVKDILTGPRPSEGGIFSNIATQVGTNIGTMAAIGIVGYLGFLYLTSRRSD